MKPKTASKNSIYSALIANLLIAITKFVAGGLSSSAAMISEGIHSLVDTVNQLLLLFGIRQSKKPADAARPFGYGKELYFWSFIVSILIFGLGGGLSIYQGITHIIHPDELRDPFWNYVVLGVSLIFEGISLFIAWKEFKAVKGNDSLWSAIIKSKNPANFLVLFEDGGAVLGLSMVAICLFIGHKYNLPWMDGFASLLVGLLLVAISMILARESRSLLMGEGIAAETQQKIIKLAEQDESVLQARHVLSTYQSPEEVVLMLIIAFKAELNTEGINAAIIRIRASIKEAYPLVSFIIIQPEAVRELS
ncbi:MAG: cation diffusion facilitator family transporter [Pedobacter sp.]